MESGAFDDDGVRVELIDGWLVVDVSQISREHMSAVMWLNKHVARGVDPVRYDIGPGAPVTIEHSQSEPQPDLAVFAIGSARPYHYASAALVIEVSVSSLRHDLLIKARLYAEAGVPEYWVVDVKGRRVIRHREPNGDIYRRIDEPRDTLIASSVELPPIDLRALFAATFS
jgi:Uma2 family endonuclease